MSWRRRARVDANHAEIVRALRAIGCTVVSLATLGRGAPDILAGYGRQTFLIEAKRPDLRDHAPDNLRERVRLEEQQDWRDRWRGGPVAVVYSAQEALDLVAGPGMFSVGAVEARRTPRRG